MSLQGACNGLTIVACDDVAILDEGIFQGEAVAINFVGPGVTATVTNSVAEITIGGGGSGSFTDITSGTNTTATMVVDTGASLAASGSGTITATAVPVGGISGLGTGVATALAVNVGTAGSVVVDGGALGTPSSGVATNLTGTASALNIGGNAATSTTTSNVSTANETGDSTCFLTFVTVSGTQASIPLKTLSTVGIDSTNGTISAPAFAGNLTGDVTGAVNGVSLTTGGSATDFLNAQGNYVAAGGGSGDVVGPPSSTDNALATFDSTTGKLLQDSVIIGDPATGNMTGVGTLASGVHTITAQDVSALTVGQSGATNPAFQVDSNVASSASGIKITSRAAATNAADIDAVSSGTNCGIRLKTKGSGVLNMGSGGSGSIILSNNNQTYVNITTTQTTFSQNPIAFAASLTNTTAATVRFNFTGAADTALTAGTEAPMAYFNFGVTRQHASNTTISLQREFRITGSTHSFASATGTITDAAALAIDGYAQAGTNSQITNGHGLYIPTQAVAGTVANAYGITVAAPTGATTNNFAINATGTIGLNGELRLTATPSADDTANGPTTNTFNAGATVAQWELVYLDSSSTWQLTDADAASTAGPVMIALAAEAKTAGNAMKVVLPGGFARNDAWAWTVGGAIYIDTTPGALTQTAPSGSGDIVRVIGYATSADTLYFMPSGAWVEVA